MVNFLLQSLYDKHLGSEFKSETQTLARVEHLNLVKFYGYLEHGDERIVVVEYVPNGTLREHLDCELSSCVALLHHVYSTVHTFMCEFEYLKQSKIIIITMMTIIGLHGKVLDLATRLEVAIDVAHAVTYLHMYTGLCSQAAYFI